MDKLKHNNKFLYSLHHKTLFNPYILFRSDLTHFDL